MTASLRHPSSGAVLASGPVATLRRALRHRPTRLVIEGELPLGAVPSGDYLLELTVRDELAGRSARTVRHVSLP